MHSTENFHSHLPLGEGRLEVICGPMFSGKTEELLRRIKRARIASQPMVLFKPAVDTRYSECDVVSHDKTSMEAVVVRSSDDILNHIEKCEKPVLVVAIDEAQFFDEKLPSICNKLANNGRRVIVAGLDLDSDGKPFGSMPQILALAEEVTKLHAVCVETGRAAHFTYRHAGGDDTIMLGEKDKYVPLSRNACLAARKDNASK